MGLMTDVRAVATLVKVDNILSGKSEEFVTRPSLVSIYATGGGAGMRMSIIAGGQTVVDDQELPERAAFPIEPDDIVAQFGLTGPSDRLVISLRNTSGGTLTARTKVKVEPVA